MNDTLKKHKSTPLMYSFHDWLIRFSGLVVLGGFTLFSSSSLAQDRGEDTTHVTLSFNEIIKYALKNQPSVKQSALDEQIAEKDINIRLSDWLPQIEVKNGYNDVLKKQVTVFPSFTKPGSGEVTYLPLGVFNQNTLGASINQTIFNNTVRVAASSAKYYRTQAKQNTIQNKIDVVVNVSKAYYDLLLTDKQAAVLKEDIERLKGTAKDAEAKYNTGASDKTDFEQAKISLNNSQSQYVASIESVKGKNAYLRQLMGMPQKQKLTVSFDSLAMLKEIDVDSTQNVDYTKRIEYQLIETQIQLQKADYINYKYQWLPNISATGDYNIVWQNDHFSKLFDKNFPNSTIGLNISVPIMTGTKRIQSQRKAELQIKKSELDKENQRNVIGAEYAQALSTYKGYLSQFKTNAENVTMARQVYDIVKLQYQQGVKPYLNLIQAETDLRSAELNYLNALFQVLNSKLDVQKALGTVNININ